MDEWISELPKANEKAAFTKLVHRYVDSIYMAILADKYSTLRSLQTEINGQSVDFRAAVWSCLPADVKDKLRDVCGDIL